MLNIRCVLAAILLILAREPLGAEIVAVQETDGQTVDFGRYAHLKEGDLLDLVLSEEDSEVILYAEKSIAIRSRIRCNGKLRIRSAAEIVHRGEIAAPYVILEASQIKLEKGSSIDASGSAGGGQIYVGGGWQGEDPSIHNAAFTIMTCGARIAADNVNGGASGVVVLWSEKGTVFEGIISAKGIGAWAQGGRVEVSSHGSFHFNGTIDVDAENGRVGSILLDPVSITIQTSNPDINGNGTNLDMTSINQINNATTTPAGFPNAASIITAGAVSGLLTNNAVMTLAAQNFITLNASLTPAGTNVHLTLSAPVVNLNSPIVLPSGGILAGSGVNTVNVGPSGLPQNGIDIAASGATVNLSSATYNAPLNILNNNLTLNGNGQANTKILVAGAIPPISGRNPAIYVSGLSNVVIQNLTVDCNYLGFPTNASIVGIAYSDAGGSILNNHVTKVANSAPPYGGGQQGISIRIASSSGGPYTVNVESNTLDFFQKAGIVCNGSQLVMNIENNNVIGPGLSSPATIGIQLNGGAGTIANNTVTGMEYMDHASSAAIFVLNAGPNVEISGNTASNSDNGIIAQACAGGMTIENNIVQNNGDSGIGIYDTTGSVSILSNTVANNGGLAPISEPNANIFLFTTTNQDITLTGNSILSMSTPGIISQGNAPGQGPALTLSNNSYCDPISVFGFFNFPMGPFSYQVVAD